MFWGRIIGLKAHSESRWCYHDSLYIDFFLKAYVEPQFNKKPYAFRKIMIIYDNVQTYLAKNEDLYKNVFQRQSFDEVDCLFLFT